MKSATKDFYNMMNPYASMQTSARGTAVMNTPLKYKTAQVLFPEDSPPQSSESSSENDLSAILRPSQSNFNQSRNGAKGRPKKAAKPKKKVPVYRPSQKKEGNVPKRRWRPGTVALREIKHYQK
mmetsp:Transcript_4823/g.4476  ORF Transcript_4823/g.4476 Transcript_4823/m.4476 type:complete len:124 (+) Transcript_4823:1-372(+)|eukprot:CAMPEP_0170541504 /NCGR_PEP_ID=MMETSP0211-20121228/1224_1 /TAXON_ID=311385 /ORGANISM="Pseudokeronopsis sp., Strain OXSARD2" /LENGTH=123 /DNA_ID=CAMNT_0010844259 /DNA_START=1 /DNA_END=372 /DNA_ORIENTATION=+